MEIKLHENGWTVFVNNIDLRDLTIDQAKEIGKLLATNTVVVIQNQQLTPQDEVRVCEKIGKIESFSKFRGVVPDVEHWIVPDTEDKILRVTGELNEHGKPGMFAHKSDLDWHANQPANEWRDPIIWLYGVRGTEGSKTSWINNVLSYNDLDEQTKESLKDIKMINGYKQNAYSEHHFGKEVDINYNYQPKLVHTNEVGVVGLFFPFLQIHQIVDMTEDESKHFINKFKDHVLQEKYAYHHEWKDGDVVLSDQWLGVHKRWECDNIATRVLHRIACDYSHIDLVN
jgi:alpha-ketoglutarate-dependent taurine dioxygenase